MTHRTDEGGPRLTITRIRARNFKSIRELDLELGPLTVLVGPNSTGKSNVLDVLRFVSHALDRDLDEAVTSRQGIGGVRRWAASGRPDVEVEVSARRGELHLDYGFVLGSSRDGLYSVKREYGVVTAGPRGGRTEFELKGGRVVKPEQFAGEMFGSLGLVLPWLMRYLFRTWGSDGSPRGMAPRARHDVVDMLDSIGGIKFYRLFPDVMRQLAPPHNPAVLEEDGGNLASVLREMLKDRSPYLAEIENALGNVVQPMGLEVRRVGGFLVVRLRRRGLNGGEAGTLFDLTQESDGTVRLLGLLTALYQDDPPAVIGMEEPELAVHPGALAVIADVMKEATLRTQLLVTTHSPDLIDLLPADCLRAVVFEDGSTRLGPVSHTQAEAVRTGLFTAGELHGMEGLEPRA